MANDVKLFALSTCIHCKKTKEFLDECGTKYECVYVDELKGDERKQVIEEVKKYNPSLSFPTILIGDKVIVGFKKEEIKELLDS
ncbi:MAG: glutaredoxin family protein [Desulfovibrionales bacterium]